MSLAAGLLRFSLVVLLVGVGPAALPAAGAGCPTTVTFEPTGAATADAGWTGLDHGLPIFGSTLPLAVTCSTSTPPCGTCTVTGIARSSSHPQRCMNDTSIPCSPASEVANCGASDTCRTLLSPPQSISVGGVAVCFIAGIGAGTVSGNVDVESGALTATVPVRADAYSGTGGFFGGAVHACPRCENDTTSNDGVPGGHCDAGLRTGQSCDANAVSVYSDFGASSFDCPPDPNTIMTSFTFGALPVSTESQSLTLSAASPNCSTGDKCFCAACNSANAEACTSNADCPVSGGDPGVCNGRRCLGGTNNGAPCVSGSACPGSGFCGQPGEPLKPNACLDDTASPADSCLDTGGGIGRCINGPVQKICSNHPNRGCTSDAHCDAVPGACEAVNRRCFLDNGILGRSLSVDGTATPPVNGIADPTTLGTVGCVPPSVSSLINAAGGFPGPLRSVQSGRLVLADTSAACPLTADTCREPIVPGKATLYLRNDPAPDRDQLQWKWPKGAATTLADLGSPTTFDDYDVCFYDASGLRTSFVVPSGGTCGGKPCWRPKTNGFSYRSKTGLPNGITLLDLKAGADGKAQIRLQGRGPLLPLPPLTTLTTALQLQLRQRRTGLCWSATFSPPYKTMSATTLRDQAD
ncbi:MAG: hypothetical protein ABIR79_11220 [Candidatus Binatia bacterium]